MSRPLNNWKARWINALRRLSVALLIATLISSRTVDRARSEAWMNGPYDWAIADSIEPTLAGGILTAWVIGLDRSRNEAGLFSSATNILKTSDFILASVAGGLLLDTLFKGSELVLRTTGSRDLEINDNISFLSDPLGIATRHRSGINAEFGTKGKQNSFTVRTNLNWADVNGPGDPGNLEAFDQFFQSEYRSHGRRYGLDVSATWSIRNAAEAQIQDTAVALTGTPTPGQIPGVQLQSTGDARADGEQRSVNVDGGFTYQVNGRNTASFRGSVTDQVFSEDTPGLVGSETLISSGNWMFQASNSTGLSMDLKYGIFMPGDDERSRIVEAILRVDTELSNRLNASASAGTVHVHTDKTHIGEPGVFVTSEGGNGLLWDFGFDLALKRTDISFQALQQLTATSGGDLQRTQVASLSFAHQINDKSYVRILTNISNNLIPASFTETVFATEERNTNNFLFSPLYSFRVNRKWTISAEYRFRYEESKTANKNRISKSNAGFFRLRRTLPAN